MFFKRITSAAAVMYPFPCKIFDANPGQELKLSHAEFSLFRLRLNILVAAVLISVLEVKFLKSGLELLSIICSHRCSLSAKRRVNDSGKRTKRF